MRGFVSLVLLAGVYATAAAALAAAPNPALEREIRTQTLAHAQRNPGALPSDNRLRAVARQHSAAMYRQQALAHVLADGLDPGDRVARHHRSLFALIAENVAYQQNWPRDGNLARRFVQSWMESPGHRRNILGSYDLLEIGCHGDRALMYCTQLFASSAQPTINRIPYRQAPGSTLTLRLDGPPIRGGRISLAPRDARPDGLGVPIEHAAARLTLPTTPGLFELHLWIPEGGAQRRYRIVGGPYVCITRARDTEPDCGM
jgi:hypothetical protein